MLFHIWLSTAVFALFGVLYARVLLSERLRLIGLLVVAVSHLVVEGLWLSALSWQTTGYFRPYGSMLQSWWEYSLPGLAVFTLMTILNALALRLASYRWQTPVRQPESP